MNDKRQKMINIWSIINNIKLLIEKLSDNSTKKKDYFSCLVYIEFGLIVSSVYIMVKPIITSINIMIANLIEFIQKQLYVNELLYIPYIVFDGAMELKFFAMSLVPVFIVYILIQCNIKRIRILFICEMIQILLFVIFFEEAIYLIILMIIIGMLISLFFPMGSGFYFDLLKYANYLPDIYEYNVCNNKEWKRIVFVLASSCIGFVLLFRKLFPIFSPKLLVLLFISIVLLLWINNSKGKTRGSLKKILVYAFFIPFVLLSNNVFELTLQNIVLVIISIFFAIDRVINLIIMLMEKIRSESLRFLIDEIPTDDYLIKERIIIEKNMQEHISDKMLIRQIVIHYMLRSEDTKTLICIYKEKGCKKESMLIGAIDYFLNETQELTLEEKKIKLASICEKKDEGILYIPILEEYAQVLYYLKSNYLEIIEILKDVWLLISNDSKYILYYAYLQTEDIEPARAIKKEIDNFIQVENRMRCKDKNKKIEK